MPRARRGLLILAVIVAGRMLGLGDMVGAPASGTSNAEPGLATALATPFGDLHEGTPVSVRLAAAAVVSAPPAFVLPTSPEQWFRPDGRNGGTEGLAKFLAAVALHENKPLYLSDDWGRTTGNGLSDHHVSRTDSWAVDVAVRGIQAPTPATELAATRIAAALGVPNWTGGDLTRTIDGYRFQVLWKVAGHFNHVHVGVRKV